ncbi:MAG: hypothetical protein RR405_05865 [Clostridia bacterium]
MDYDENKKIEVEISENQYVEKRIEEKKKHAFKGRFNLDALDICIIPLTVGVFVSLGFLFASLFKISAISNVINEITSVLSSVI